MEKTPFAFGKIVRTHAFTNREKEAEKLTRNLLGGIHTMLISPRRWGKSSLVEKVIALHRGAAEATPRAGHK